MKPGIFAGYLRWLYRQAEKQNVDNLATALKETGPHSKMLDVGCWDGQNTLVWGRMAQSEQLYGLEPVPRAAERAAGQNIKVFQVEADKDEWPLGNNALNCIISNQVVEHLNDLDRFFQESARVLVKGGYLITSTNNLSSWHNLFSLVMGWAPFDLTNSSSKKTGIGNPIAAHPMENHPYGPTWVHHCVYTIRWLKDWGALYGYKTIKQYGAGYYPLPASFGLIDPNHSAFITLVMKRVK